MSPQPPKPSGFNLYHNKYGYGPEDFWVVAPSIIPPARRGDPPPEWVKSLRKKNPRPTLEALPAPPFVQSKDKQVVDYYAKKAEEWLKEAKKGSAGPSMPSR